MVKSQQVRMLFSHNFDISNNLVPKLSREEFALYLIDGFNVDAEINCSAVNNPHWIVEVLFDSLQHSPLSIGTLCVQALANKRKTQKGTEDIPLNILALGGIKTTPAISTTSTSLQPGDWGVDVVETANAEQFLKSMGWEAISASKPPENIFSFKLQV